jgi:hypothetical protein
VAFASTVQLVTLLGSILVILVFARIDPAVSVAIVFGLAGMVGGFVLFGNGVETLLRDSAIVGTISLILGGILGAAIWPPSRGPLAAHVSAGFLAAIGATATAMAPAAWTRSCAERGAADFCHHGTDIVVLVGVCATFLVLLVVLRAPRREPDED